MISHTTHLMPQTAVRSPIPLPKHIVCELRTHPGQKRSINEDALAVIVHKELSVTTKAGVLLVVADGVGGLEAGEEASQITIEEMQEAYDSYAKDFDRIDRKQWLSHAIHKAHQRIREQNDEQATSAGPMGSTVVAALVVEDSLFYANVGDSRAYLLEHTYKWLFGRSTFQQLTHDDTVIDQALTQGSRREHPYGNVLTQALGSNKDITVLPKFRKLRAGSCVLLCSDGLTDMVSEKQIEHVLQHYPPDVATRMLVDLANEAGGLDNISVIVVQVGQTTSQKLSPRNIVCLGIILGSGLLFLGTLFLAIRSSELQAAFFALAGAALTTLVISTGFFVRDIRQSQVKR